MRTLVASAGALLLAACGSNDVPSPAERQQQSATAPQVEADHVLLRGDGLTIGAEAFYFAAGQNEVQAALASALGSSVDLATNDECGAGPMQFADYPGRLRVNFQNGSVVGWIVDKASESVSVIGEVQIGSSRDDAMDTDGFEMFSESTLGEEFYFGPDIGGFLDEDSVSMLYAGTQCFFR